MDNEEKYIDIANKLKGLEKVEASHNFTHNLQAKIIEFESEKRKEHTKRNEDTKGGFLRDLFGNLQYPWIVPAAGFTILIFFVFYITYQNKDVFEKSNDSPVTQESQSIKEPEPTNPGKSSDEQTPPVVTENSGTNSESNTDQNTLKKENGNSLSNEKLSRENSNALALSDKGVDKKSEKVTIYSERNLNPKPTENENLTSDTEEKDELSKSEYQDDKKEENNVNEFKGMVNEENSRTMATFTEDAKDTNASKKDKNNEIRNLMLKIKQIDKKALEQIQDEISK